MLALAGLAIDLASLRDARGEAQRAADAIALAGASAFRDYPFADASTRDSAGQRAWRIGRKNTVRSDTINVGGSLPAMNTVTYGGGKKAYTYVMPQVTLNIIPDSQKVRAWVRHAGVATFFGGMLGVPYGHVQAMATAWATNAGPVVNCMKPFVMPDMWWEGDKTTQDKNSNNYWDPNTSGLGKWQDGEVWKYEPVGIVPGGKDYYRPYDPSQPAVDASGHIQTGYGSQARAGIGYPGDVGLPMLIKPQTGNGNGKPAPERQGNAFWLLDLDPNANTADEIKSGCGNQSIGQTVPYQTGGATGQVKHGVDYLVNLDPGATWNQSTKRVDGSAFSDWTQSPRVIIIGLIDPKYWTTTSKNTKPDPGSVYSNFARMFLLDAQGNDNVEAIFLGPAPGGQGGPTGGTLVKVLQLIE
jgi:hypothetical protein